MKCLYAQPIWIQIVCTDVTIASNTDNIKDPRNEYHIKPTRGRHMSFSIDLLFSKLSISIILLLIKILNTYMLHTFVLDMYIIF